MHVTGPALPTNTNQIGLGNSCETPAEELQPSFSSTGIQGLPRAIEIELANRCRVKSADSSKEGNINLPRDTFTEEELGGVHKIGRGIYGQDCYPVSPERTPELWKEYEKIWRVATKEKGLDPFPTHFWMMKRDILLETGARSGFPVRVRHWSFGQEFEDLHLQMKHGYMKINEMVINNNPCRAYLLEENALHDQKYVICHVMGHSDFFKNNVMFQHTDRKMIHRMADHAGTIKEIIESEEGEVVTSEDVERFIDKYKSIEWLIDIGTLKPKQLDPKKYQDKRPEKVAPDFGTINLPGFPEHIQRMYNQPEKVNQLRKEEQKHKEDEVYKIPSEPDADVLGFLIEHSTVLKSWQRNALALLRDESYYFAPQLQTKIMNEGWATYWHFELMNHKDIREQGHAFALGKHHGATTALPKFGFQPYTIGLEIFRDIKRRWDKGWYGPKWEDEIKDTVDRGNYDTKEMNGTKKIFDVRKRYRDVQFIREFLTDEVVRNLEMYTWSTKGEPKEGADIYLKSRNVEAIKDMLIREIINGGQPLIRVVNGNFSNRGELLLDHVWTYDLREDWLDETLKNIKALWGRPVGLLTYTTDLENGEQKKMWVRVFDGEKGGIVKNNHVERFIIDENGKILYECDPQGKRK